MNKLMALVSCCLIAASAAFAEVITIASGQTVTVATDEVIPADRVYDIAAGGTLDLNGTTQTFAGLTGKGTVANGRLTLTLDGGPYLFCGLIVGGAAVATPTLTFAANNDEEHGFILGNADALAAVSYTEPKIAGACLRFQPGIGTFNIKEHVPVGQQEMNVEDLNGDPVRVYAAIKESNKSSFKPTGCGDYFTTGRLGGGGLNLSTVAGMVGGRFGPYSADPATGGTFAGLDGLEGLEIGSTGAMGIPDTADHSVVEAPWNIYNGGVIQFNCEMILPAYRYRSLGGGSSVLKFAKDLTLKDGVFGNQGGGRTLVVAGSTVRTLTLDNAAIGSFSGSAFTFPQTTRYDNNANIANLAVVVTNGGIFGTIERVPTEVKVAAGGTFLCDGGASPSGFTPIFVDGGAFGVQPAYTYQTYKPLPDGTHEIQVGAKGATIMGFSRITLIWAGLIEVGGRIRTADGVAKDGGVTHTGTGTWKYLRPLEIAGDFFFKDGFISIPGGVSADQSSDLFGTGDFVFGNGYLSNESALNPVRLASAAGAQMRVVGAAELNLGPSDWTFGPASASKSALVREPGAVLILRHADTMTADATSPSVTVAGGVPSAASGLSKFPVVLYGRDKAKGVNRLGFAKYDGGFKLFTDTVGSLADVSEDAVVALSSSQEVLSDAHVAALNVGGKTVTISEGAKLTLGNGTDPALVLLNVSGANFSQIEGAGTLDFGTSEGVFVSPIPANRGGHGTINARIVGTGGVSYNGVYAGSSNGEWEAVRIGGDNAYSGDTHINSVCAYASNSNAFGVGKVVIGGGLSYRAGRLCLNAEGLVITNDIDVAGFGGPHYNGANDDASQPGALSFACNSKLTGRIKVDGRTAFGTYEDTQRSGHEGVIEGVISGDTVIVRPGPGSIVMTAANTYTGRTEIYGRLVLRGGAARAGVNDIVLCSATAVLRIENDVPIVIPNRIWGIGTIELAGTAPVTFADIESYGGSFDLCGGDRTVSSIGELMSGVVNSAENADNVLTVTNPNVRLKATLGTGVRIAPGAGAALNLTAVSGEVPLAGGDGYAFGGSVLMDGEIRPGGEGAIGTLRLATPPRFGANAELVTEVGEAGVDKLEVAGDVDRSQLSLEVVRLGKPVKTSGPYLEAVGGELTGNYKSMVKPTRGETTFTTSDSVDGLTYSAPGLLLLVR